MQQLHPIVQRLFDKKGFNHKMIEDFLSWDLKTIPDMSSLKDLSKASARIISAINNNEKIGIYAGPNVSANYNYRKERIDEQNDVNDKKTHETTLALGVGAGVYYRLSERWWLDASLGFATPFSLGYTKINNDFIGSNTSSTSNQFTYNLSPSFTFPSVGLGLRYFLAH